MCLLAPAAQAAELSAGLGIPRLSFSLLFGQSPPPVIVPDAPVTPPGPSATPIPRTPDATPPQGAATDGADHIRLRDGRQLRGKILSQVQDGFLFNDLSSNATFVVPFGQIADLQRAAPPPPPPAFTPTLAPGGPLLPTDRRLFLESELRTLQVRYEQVSIWPGIEGLAGGVVGLGVGVVLLAVFGTSDGLELFFAGLSGATGLISLISGIVSLVSAENQKAQISAQMAQVQDQLAHLPPAVGWLPRPMAVAFRF